METELTVKMRIRHVLPTIVLVLAAVPGISAAQIIPSAGDVKLLRETRSLKCAFPWYASADWDADEPRLKTAPQKDFSFVIDGINYRSGAARLIGNAGSEDLRAVLGDGSVSFVEQVSVGTLNLTTVFAWRDRAGRFKAVHSRHTAIGGPTPSQNYGYCQSW